MREREELHPYKRLRVVRAEFGAPIGGARLDGLRCEAGERRARPSWR